MRRAIAILFAVALAGALATSAGAKEFGFESIDMTIEDQNGVPSMQAGSHPFAVKTSNSVITEIESGKTVPGEEVKDIKITLPRGFAGSVTAVPPCTAAEFLGSGSDVEGFPDCADTAAVGVARVEVVEPGQFENAPIYNLVPAPGTVAKLGLIVVGRAPVVIDFGLNPDPPYNVTAVAEGVSQSVFYLSSDITIWGVPADSGHDPVRGSCLSPNNKAPSCPIEVADRPFITLPTDCEGPLETGFEVDSWQHPGAWLSYTAFTHDDSEPPNPLALEDCSKLLEDFAPEITSQPTAHQAESPSGLNFSLDIKDEGLTNPTGRAQSTIKKMVLTMPEGVTVNPSIAEGLATCTPGQYASEAFDSAPGQGCPQASKIGTLEAETPLLEGTLVKGSLFVAQQDDPTTTTPGAENPFDSLIALYLVFKEPQRGLMLKLPAKVEPDPQTGRLVATLENMPELPFSHARLHLREGGRSPLVTPPRCGSFDTEAKLTPWANPASTYLAHSSFEITGGVNGAPCPPGGTPPFDPGFEAGSINNNAASYSPFYMRLIRHDGDQDLTKLATLLPPGMLAKLAGVGKCSDASIALAKTKRGRAELASPSCPVDSQIGRVLAGAGTGPELTYVPGKIYLAGPYNGAPLSVVAIVPAVAGPFDVGTVVTRLALDIDSRTAEARVDGSRSDPIPHILAGIPLKVRDIRAYVDRPSFTLNPTNCDPFKVGAQLWGGGNDLFSSADDSPVSRSVPFQAANCASLGFKPKLDLRLKGGTRRGSHPALRAVVTPRSKDANFSGAVVTLPRSAFLDQAHIRTICTRVQFAADACPQGAIYGQAKAWTPLLDEPLEGPVYLRSSNHNLPDLVIDLHGIVDVELSSRLDSHKGGIRSSFEAIPDAPVSRFILSMQGGRKGLIVNSRNLCAHSSATSARLSAQNGRRLDSSPLLKASCSKGHSAKRRRSHRR